MKKIIFILALFVSFVANAQYTPPTGYTNINSRYDWLAGVFRALGLPAGGNAAFTTGQAVRAGSVYYDSTGTDSGFYVYTGTYWRNHSVSTGSNNTNAGSFYRWLKTGTQEIKTFAPGYGILIDSTTNTDALTARVDTSEIAYKDWVTDRIAEIDTATLLFDSLGVDGISPMTTWNNTLYARRLSVTGGSLDTTASGGLHLTIAGGGTIGGSIANNQVAVGNGANSIAGSSALTFNGEKLEIIGAAATQETLFRASVSDDATSYFSITNGTASASRFNPIFTGETGVANNQIPLFFLGQTTAALDGGSTPMIIFDSRRTTPAAIATRPLFDFRNNGTSVFIINPSTATYTGSLTVNGGFVGGASALGIGSALATTSSQYLVEGQAGIGYRTAIYGATGYTIPTADYGWSSTVIGASPVTERSSGNMPLLSSLVIKAPVITGAAGTVSNTATAYIEDAPSATVSGANYALWVKAGNTRFGGNVLMGGSTSGTITVSAPAIAGTNTITWPAATGTVALTSNLATLTKNLMLENPGAAENIFIFRTADAITITGVNAVLVGSATPSVTYNIAFGTDRTSLTNVYTAGQTVTSTTTGDAASGFNDATIPANSWVVLTTSAQSGTVTQLNTSINFTKD